MQKFSGYKCEECGKITFLKRAVCPDCKGRKFSQTDLDESGKLLTYTQLYAPPEGIEELPLLLGIIELDNGVRLTAQITDSNIKIGDKLQPVWGKLRKIQNKEVFGFKFQPKK